MTCLCCRHLVIEDRSEDRLFACGHDVESTLDSNDGATVIAIACHGGERSVFQVMQQPVWCPLKTTEVSE